LTLIESMKGPEAKVLYNHVLDELGRGLPGGKDKVKGMDSQDHRLIIRWSVWGNNASRYLERCTLSNLVIANMFRVLSRSYLTRRRNRTRASFVGYPHSIVWPIELLFQSFNNILCSAEHMFAVCSFFVLLDFFRSDNQSLSSLSLNSLQITKHQFITLPWKAV
jgi:hypothetical protein